LLGSYAREKQKMGRAHCPCADDDLVPCQHDGSTRQKHSLCPPTGTQLGRKDDLENTIFGEYSFFSRVF
jgi:hypothetical protein